MNYSILKLQIGPVQDFIAQARSTRDLWSGSYLLSWLMAAGAKALVDALGGDSKAVISPVLNGQPIYEFHCDPSVSISPDRTEAILTPNFTNILVAYLPTDQAMTGVKAMVEAIKNERDTIAKVCWKKLTDAGLVDPSREDDCRHCFFTQAKRFPSTTWQITRLANIPTGDGSLPGVPLAAELKDKICSAASGGDWFPALLTQNSWELDAVRSLRTFTGWDSRGPENQKDSLTGREEAVLGGKDWWEKHVKRRHQEAQAAFAAKRPLGNFLWPILFRERQKDDWFGALQLIKRLWHWAYLTEVRGLDATHRREPKGKQFPFPSTLHLAIHDPAKNLDENSEELRDSAWAEVAAGQATPYFAALAMDGDHMGAWLGGENNPAGPTKAFREDLSARLSNFALHCVRPIVEACDGRLILAGGEDVLALLPADTAVDCARFLRAAYRGESGFIAPLKNLAERLRRHHEENGYEEPPDRDEKKPEMSPFLVAAARGTLFGAVDGKQGTLWFDPSLTTADSGRRCELALPGGIERSLSVPVPDVSAGLAIAHFKEPLQDVVQAALAAEKRAKNDLDRGSLAVTLVKHSGETVKWGCKWESKGLDLLDTVQAARGREVISSRFPHRVVEVLSRYLRTREDETPARLAPDPAFETKADEIIQREVAVVLERQKGKAPSQERDRFLKADKNNFPDQLRTFLTQSREDAEQKLRAVIGLCQIAAFVEPAVHSTSFVGETASTSERA